MKCSELRRQFLGRRTRVANIHRALPCGVRNVTSRGRDKRRTTACIRHASVPISEAGVGAHGQTTQSACRTASNRHRLRVCRPRRISTSALLLSANLRRLECVSCPATCGCSTCSLAIRADSSLTPRYRVYSSSRRLERDIGIAHTQLDENRIVRPQAPRMHQAGLRRVACAAAREPRLRRRHGRWRSRPRPGQPPRRRAKRSTPLCVPTAGQTQSGGSTRRNGPAWGSKRS